MHFSINCKYFIINWLSNSKHNWLAWRPLWQAGRQSLYPVHGQDTRLKVLAFAYPTISESLIVAKNQATRENQTKNWTLNPMNMEWAQPVRQPANQAGSDAEGP